MLPYDIFAMGVSINAGAAQAYRRQPCVIVEHVNPPIPVRSHDYRATFDSYEPGDPIGWGATPEAAVADLLDATSHQAAAPAEAPSIQELAAGAHYPQVTGWTNPAPNAEPPLNPSPSLTVQLGARPNVQPKHTATDTDNFIRAREWAERYGQLELAAELAAEALDEAQSYTSCETWSPSMTEECKSAAQRLRDVLSASVQAPAPGPEVPADMVLVPKRMSREMIQVTEDEGWTWADLLAAAEAITEDEHALLAASPVPAAPSPAVPHGKEQP